jgi:hypothetical protein
MARTQFATKNIDAKMRKKGFKTIYLLPKFLRDVVDDDCIKVQWVSKE